MPEDLKVYRQARRSHFASSKSSKGLRRQANFFYLDFFGGGHNEGMCFACSIVVFEGEDLQSPDSISFSLHSVYPLASRRRRVQSQTTRRRPSVVRGDRWCHLTAEWGSPWHVASNLQSWAVSCCMVLPCPKTLSQMLQTPGGLSTRTLQQAVWRP